MRPLLRSRETDTLRADLMSGARIANARGIPGSVGFLALTRHDRQLVMVTAHHVLFGDGARAGDPVWLAADGTRAAGLQCVGWSLYGRAGNVRQGDVEAYVDCAVASLDLHPPLRPAWSITGLAPARISVAPGDRVSKRGAATGLTEGLVVSVDHRLAAVRRGPIDARRQILVRGDVRGRPFSAEGDSGSALRDRDGRIVGLIWGVTPGGESLACPIAPVLDVLHVTPALFAPNGGGAFAHREAD